MACNCGARRRQSTQPTKAAPSIPIVNGLPCNVRVTNGQVMYGNKTYKEGETFQIECDTAQKITNIVIESQG